MSMFIIKGSIFTLIFTLLSATAFAGSDELGDHWYSPKQTMKVEAHSLKGWTIRFFFAAEQEMDIYDSNIIAFQFGRITPLEKIYKTEPFCTLASDSLNQDNFFHKSWNTSKTKDSVITNFGSEVLPEALFESTFSSSKSALVKFDFKCYRLQKRESTLTMGDIRIAMGQYLPSIHVTPKMAHE